jgi:2-(3-amino-3-carboxypropyl)histidine synthase
MKKRIMLQFPEGLKKDALKESEKYSNKYDVIISSEPSYGACDIPVNEAKELGCFKIVHYGHSKFMEINEEEIEIEYVPHEIKFEKLGKLIELVLKEIKEYEKIGIITNLTHVNQMDEIKSMLEKEGKKTIISRGSVRCNNPGQILGCDVTSLNKTIEQKVDCIIYFGAGKFHAFAPGAMEEKLDVPFLWVNPFSNEIKFINEEIDRIQKQRKISLMKASEAKVYGILISSKIGQHNLKKALEIKEKIEEKGKKGIIIYGNTFDFVSLNNFVPPIECFINTACPRIVDDQNKFSVAIVDYKEFQKI